MKLVIAIIRPERLDAVQEELRRVLDEQDNYRITIDTVQGHGRQHGDVEYMRGQPVQPRLVTKVRVMVAVNDPYVDRTIEAICEGARTAGDGAVGDGKIMVMPLEDVIRIRTGERGPKAI
ncbi:MAG: P-II family nitrogen regulator [Deltaproteobacteria bacterium]|nr:P-II family nitrogen regulator [Deltaproteobacteria bacterium]